MRTDNRYWRTLWVVCLSGLGLASSALAKSAPALPDYGAPLTLEQAQAAMNGAEALAGQSDLRLSIAVVEPNGQLVLFKKMTQAQYASVDVAIAKARTAALFKKTTKAMSATFAENQMRALAIPTIVPIEGGAPIVVNGVIVGAIGVSGGTTDEDGAVASAGAAAVSPPH